MLALFFASFLVSVVVAHVIVRSEHWHDRFTTDIASRRSHKVHVNTVCRVGGVSIFIGWVAGLVASSVYLNSFSANAVWIACLLPVFLSGLVEDLTKRVGPLTRLLGAFLSAGLASILLGATVTRIDIPGLDALLAIPPVAFVFTLIAVGGVAHAVNIIDGLNGLASAVCLMALLALGYVAFQVGDTEILLMAGFGVAALFGFHIWNYPSGRIFLGDGGAYFLGGYIAILSTLLVGRHASVSAWFPLLLVLYPVWETLFSAYRRRFLRGLPATRADKLHLHTLIYKRVKRRDLQTNGWRTRRNSDAAVPMIMLAGCNVLPAILWWSEGLYLMATAFVYVIVYVVIYWRLVRFGVRGKKRGGRMFGATPRSSPSQPAARTGETRR